jgi:hypothetical protein
MTSFPEDLFVLFFSLKKEWISSEKPNLTFPPLASMVVSQSIPSSYHSDSSHQKMTAKGVTIYWEEYKNDPGDLTELDTGEV